MRKPPLVLDTNIVLDLWVFQDPATQGLAALLQSSVCPWDWIATAAMREELARVLGYPAIAQRLQQATGQANRPATRSANDVLAAFDRHARLVHAAARSHLVCRDADDQQFIDLAIAYQSHLLSKDRALIAMKKSLQRYGVQWLAVA